MTILLFTLTVIAMFAAGYYLGHQIGSTAHIREHLATQRQHRQ